MELKVLNKQNNSRMCLVCGFKNDLSLKAEFYELEDKSLCALVTFRDVHQGYPSRVHGGILAAILDETIGRAMMPYTGEEKWGVTMTLTTKYKKPVPINEQIRAKELLLYIINSYFENGTPFLFFKDNVNNAHKHPELGIIRSSNLCVSGDTNILTKEYGYIPIGTLVESGVTGATCWNGEEWSETPLFKTNDNQKLLTVHLSNGETINATEYHKWHRVTDNGIEKIITTELKPGDKLENFNLDIIDNGNNSLPNAYDLGMSTLSKGDDYFVPDSQYMLKDRLSWLAGLIDGNGSLVNNELHIKSNNQELTRKLLYFLQEIGVKSKWFKEEYCTLVIPNSEFNKLVNFKLETKVIEDITASVSSSEDINYVTVVEVKDNGISTATYCGNEPKRHKLMFNGVLTGNCTEIMLPTSNNETAVCNLGSVNISKVHTIDDLRRVISIGLRAMDNCIDLTEYPSEDSERFQKKVRSVGCGFLGEAELLVKKEIEYGSKEHEELLHYIYGNASIILEEQTRELANEKGSCVVEGMRNAYLSAIAPNSSSGVFACTTSSHEPVINKIWKEDRKADTITLIAPGITRENSKYYKTAFEIDTITQVRMNGIRQKYIDMGISFNLYIDSSTASAGRIKDVILEAWKCGLKSTYYLRSKSPSNNDVEEVELLTSKGNIKCVGCEN